MLNNVPDVNYLRVTKEIFHPKVNIKFNFIEEVFRFYKEDENYIFSSCMQCTERSVYSLCELPHFLQVKYFLSKLSSQKKYKNLLVFFF